MAFRLSSNSKRRLDTVDPRLAAVVRRAIEITEVDFAVVQGLRTRDEQARLYGKGRSPLDMARLGLPMEYANPAERKVTWTMRSNHMTGRAVDLAAFVNGGVSWDTTKGYYDKIAVAMKKAAMELCTPIAWGGDWSSTKDYPHFELESNR